MVMTHYGNHQTIPAGRKKRNRYLSSGFLQNTEHYESAIAARSAAMADQIVLYLVLSHHVPLVLIALETLPRFEDLLEPGIFL